jgi:hypothetical protein
MRIRPWHEPAVEANMGVTGIGGFNAVELWEPD